MFWYFLTLLIAIIPLKHFQSYRAHQRYKNSKNWDPASKVFKHYWKRNTKVSKWKAALEYFKTPSPTWPDALSLQHTPQTNTSTNQITNIGHATFLIQLNGCNILTDPVFSDRAGPFGIFGPKRIIPPGISIDKLPPIHAVFVSHNHYDHLDAKSIKTLAKSHDSTFVVPLGLKKKVQNWCPHHTVIELDWWEKTTINDIEITATPAQHWSRRSLFDMNKTLWMGGLFSSQNHSVFFAGDTGRGPHFSDIAEKHPSIDAALLPIGAYRPKLVMQTQHMGPEDALNAHLALKSKSIIPAHYDVFKLGKESYQEAEEELVETAKHMKVSKDSLSILNIGEQLSLTKLRNS